MMERNFDGREAPGMCPHRSIPASCKICSEEIKTTGAEAFEIVPLSENVKEEIPHLWSLLATRMRVRPGGDIVRVEPRTADQRLPFTEPELRRVNEAVIEALEKNQVPEVIFIAKFNGTDADHVALACKHEGQNTDWPMLSREVAQAAERKLGPNPSIRTNFASGGRPRVNIYEYPNDPGKVIVRGDIGTSGTDSSNRLGQSSMQMLLAKNSMLYRMLTSESEQDVQLFYRASLHVAAELRPDARPLLAVVYPDDHPTILNLAEAAPTMVDMRLPLSERKAVAGDKRFEGMLREFRRPLRGPDSQEIGSLLMKSGFEATRENANTLRQANSPSYSKYFTYRREDSTVPEGNAPAEQPQGYVPRDLGGTKLGRKQTQLAGEAVKAVSPVNESSPLPPPDSNQAEKIEGYVPRDLSKASLGKKRA